MFQSSPDSKVGCNNNCPLDGKPIAWVSILTRLEGRVQQPTCHYLLVRGKVSILTRLEGRVQLLRHGDIAPLLRFNPHPTRRSGATPH